MCVHANQYNMDIDVSCLCLQPVLSRAGVEGVDMDTQSCVDHSILAILEDSTVASEVRVKADSSK